MKPRYLFFFILAIVIIGVLMLTTRLQKTITIIINGVEQRITTPALTVGGALNLAKISVNEQDVLSPDKNQLLHQGDVVKLERTSQFHILVDGERFTIESAERSIEDLLSVIDIPFSPDDRIFVNGLPHNSDELLDYVPTQSIQIIRSIPIYVSVNSEQFNLHTSATTLGQALWNNGIRLYKKDRIEPEVTTLLDKPLAVVVHPSIPIEIKILDQTMIERTSANTVGNTLEDSGIPLQGLDYSLPPENAPIPTKGLIQVVRVREEVVVETSPIQFETEYKPISDLTIDNQQIMQPGEIGLSAQRFRVRYENNIEMEWTTESEYIAKQPSNRIIGYGTKLEPQTISISGGTVRYWRALDMYAVSYNPTSAGGSITASGLPLQKGIAAVDPQYIPYGTRLYIPGYGEAVAADTGPGITPRMIDLGYSDDDYVSWHQPVTVYFLWPPPENIAWIIP